MDRQSAVTRSRNHELAELLRRFESRNVTYLGGNGPIFWRCASDAQVIDADGKVYVDLTAGFGVVNAGHSNPKVVAAIADQAARLTHAMGDIYPADVKAALLETLALVTPGELSKTFLASSGADAIEAALKTAVLATGKSAFVAFRNSYHGLSLGTLEVSGIKKFTQPFLSWLPQRTLFLDYPSGGQSADRALEYARRAFLKRADLAAVIVEPIQGRAGIIVPPKGFLSGLRRLCTERGMLLICDEIYTGFGRTGTLFACENERVVPDILCVGKALGNGFPISATVGTPAVMDAWPISHGEALHTSTHLGNPMGCAAALATIDEITQRQLPEHAANLGEALAERFESWLGLGLAVDVRGRGLMWGIELTDNNRAHRIVELALDRGVLLLQEGPDGNVLSITPPLVIAQDELMHAVDTLEGCLKDIK